MEIDHHWAKYFQRPSLTNDATNAQIVTHRVQGNTKTLGSQPLWLFSDILVFLDIKSSVVTSYISNAPWTDDAIISAIV